MKGLLFACSLFVLACSSNAQVSDSRPISHEKWDQLLKKHVEVNGDVDYSGFKKDEALLDEYLVELSANHPNDKNWSEPERLAYWINAYNAFTIKLVIDHYPVASIKDIKKGIPMVNSVWDIKFIEIEGQEYDLNNIEHSILRKEHEEPRIHFAVNCASISCPVLLNEAYTADKLEDQLDRQTRAFLADPVRNKVAEDELQLSKIFSWFTKDFTRDGTVQEFVDKYSDVNVSSKARISYLDYNWGINDKG